MTGILFLLAVIAFLIVAHWAFVNDRAGDKSGYEGLLAMRDPVEREGRSRRRPPRWAQGGPREPTGEDPPTRGPQPRWRRAAQHGRWRA
jgi:hypothetical protein